MPAGTDLPLYANPNYCANSEKVAWDWTGPVIQFITVSSSGPIGGKELLNHLYAIVLLDGDELLKSKFPHNPYGVLKVCLIDQFLKFQWLLRTHKSFGVKVGIDLYHDELLFLPHGVVVGGVS